MQKVGAIVKRVIRNSDLARGLTISLGLSAFKSKMALTDLVGDADKNLYAAKSMRRNQMVY